MDKDTLFPDNTENDLNLGQMPTGLQNLPDTPGLTRGKKWFMIIKFIIVFAGKSVV